MESKVTTKEDLIERILEERERLSFFGVTSIGLFGSFVRGEQTPLSDIDILVEFTPEKHPLIISWRFSSFLMKFWDEKLKSLLRRVSVHTSAPIF
jgi:predicted nucleotidyltransferase